MKTADMNGTTCEPQSLNEEKPTQNKTDDKNEFCSEDQKSKDEDAIPRETATTNQTSDEQKTSNGDTITQIQMQSAEKNETCTEATSVSETSQQHSQTTDRGQNEDEDHVREVIKEWTNVEEFNLMKFFIILFSASLTFFDFFSDGLLGIQFLQEGFVFNSSKTDDDFIDGSCTALNITTFNYDEYNQTRRYDVGSYTCDKYNRMYGFATLAISFLPGIQWHAYLKTKYSLGKFLTSLFFPFFMVIFQVSLFPKVFSDVKGQRFCDPY